MIGRRVGAVVLAGVLVAAGQFVSSAAAPPTSAEPAGSEVLIFVQAGAEPTAPMPRIGDKITAVSVRQAHLRARRSLLGASGLGGPAPTSVGEEAALAASVGGRQAFVEPIVADGGVLAASSRYMTVGECTGKAASTYVGGYYKNRWSWCQSLTLYIYNSLDGYIVGRGSFQSTVVGKGWSGSRKVVLDQYINEVQYGGSWPTGGPALKPSINCRGIPAQKHCRVSGGNRYFQIGRGSSHHITYTLTSSADDATRGSEKVSVGIFTPRYTIQTPRSTATENGDTQGMRCDSAPYLGSAGACIFDRTRATFTLQRSDRAVSQVAAHDRDALRRAPNLYPGKGKPIPSLLSRLTSSKGINANRNTSRAACRKKWGATPHGKDCDEYPFASTNQGSAKANGKYSVRYLASTQNRTAGSRLGGWYKSNRILNGDQFKVVAK